METPSTFAPAIKDFLERELPADSGTHTLALSEAHDCAEHHTYLKDHLDSLKRDHNLTTIGVEASTFMNVLIWAYQDGTLERTLGDKESAKQYFREQWEHYASAEFISNAQASAELILAALDKGIDVVAFDGRDTRRKIEGHMNMKILPPREGGLSIGAGIAIMHARSAPRATASTHDADAGENMRALLFETDWVTNLNPSYRPRLQAIEKLVMIGHEKIHKGLLSSDALSATIFNTLAKHGNRITISGISHNDGIGASDENAVETVHGTFAQHLFAQGEPMQGHTVTHAVIACTALIDEVQDHYLKHIAHPQSRFAVAGTVPLINIDTGEVAATEEVPPQKTIPLTEKFPFKPTSLFSKRPKGSAWNDRQAAHINPLLIPEIKQAADHVRVLFGINNNSLER